MSGGDERGADAPPAVRPRGPYRRSAGTRAAILAAATEVFTEKGYHASSMREIARRCGVDQSTVAHHFPDKAALLLSLMQERDRRGDEILAVSRSDDIDEVPDSLLELARHNSRTPGIIELYTLLAAESVTPGHPLGDFFVERTDRVRAGFRAWFAELDAAGRLRDGVTPDLAATSLLALWEGAQLHWLIDRDAVDVVRLLETFLRLIIDDPDPRSPGPDTSPEGEQRP